MQCCLMFTVFFSYFFQYVSCFDFYRKLECLSLANRFVRSSSDSMQLIYKWDLQNCSQAGQVPPCFLTLVTVSQGESYTCVKNGLKISMLLLYVPSKHPAIDFKSISHEGGREDLLSVLVLTGIELIFFLVAGIVLCLGFSTRMMLIMH